MQNKPRALIVDDEKQMTAIVAFTLETQGFVCDCTHRGSDAKQLLAERNYQLIVLDVLMPGISGVELTRQIRAMRVETPIILLTALGEEEHRIKGLEAGADDYVTKPFSPRELALRAGAIVRRAQPAKLETQIKIGELSVDTQRIEAKWQEKIFTESLTEVRILWLLANNADELVPARTLITKVWNTTDLTGGREMLKTAIYRLRKKMQGSGLDSSCIESRRSLGYALNSALMKQ
ncbi:response regulator transcription factor [Arcanobacterium hippocoleae]|uniref:DNA-binding response OmpR family regulator n=1 Tax=Arcanobacterium hippocoleae TaxID=149017 RepID=A0ABU1T3D9_9ACTO|nr:response regulator transcription factor [Arcanobacterium hippocoleae]MDR6939884.1 DNA-binding response OmpR family regulator [Arcanobacterium hippocoleae]